MATEKRIECMKVDEEGVAKERADETARRQYIADIVREWEEVLYPETTEALREYVQELIDKS